ncbi:MAG: oligosaccharide flippase family protein [Sulfobacillus sp.]
MAQTLITNVLILALNLGTGVLTARFLLPKGRGELAAIILWPQFLAYLLTLGVPVSLVYHIKRQPERAGQLVAAALVLGTVMGFVATLAGVVGIPLWLHGYAPAVVRFAQLCMLVAPVALVGIILVCAVQAREAFVPYNRIRYVIPLLILSVLVLLAVAQRLTVETAALGYLLGGLPVFFATAVWVARHLRPVWNDLRSAARQLLGYGLRAWGSDLVGTLAGQLDRVLVVGLLDARDMGLYVVAQSLARLVSFIPNAVVPVLLPKAAGRVPLEGIALVRRTGWLSFAAMVVAAFPVILLGRWVLALIYGPEFAPAALLLRLLTIEAVLAGLAVVLTQALMALNRPGAVTLAQGATLALLMPLLLWLVPRYGLAGAGMALLASTTLRLLLIAWLLRRAHHTQTVTWHGAA